VPDGEGSAPYSQDGNFRVDDLVEARCNGGQLYFPGTITSVNANGSYNILYQDKDAEKGVAAEFVRRRESSGGAGPRTRARPIFQLQWAEKHLVSRTQKPSWLELKAEAEALFGLDTLSPYYQECQLLLAKHGGTPAADWSLPASARHTTPGSAGLVSHRRRAARARPRKKKGPGVMQPLGGASQSNEREGFAGTDSDSDGDARDQVVSSIWDSKRACHGCGRGGFTKKLGDAMFVLKIASYWFPRLSRVCKSTPRWFHRWT
jgi:hypothetical protein